MARASQDALSAKAAPLPAQTQTGRTSKKKAAAYFATESAIGTAWIKRIVGCSVALMSRARRIALGLLRCATATKPASGRRRSAPVRWTFAICYEIDPSI